LSSPVILSFCAEEMIFLSFCVVIIP
jgi:hypothetical protein